MTSRTRKISLVVLAVLALSACSAGVGANETPSATGGAIELAVAETCAKGSDPKCVSVKGEYVVLPSAFERAGVEDATAAEGQGPNTVDVTFTKEGATVLHTLTEKAARAKDSARLVLKIGGEIQSVVTVMQAVDNGRVQIGFSPDDKRPGSHRPDSRRLRSVVGCLHRTLMSVALSGCRSVWGTSYGTSMCPKEIIYRSPLSPMENPGCSPIADRFELLVERHLSADRLTIFA